MKEISISLQI